MSAFDPLQTIAKRRMIHAVSVRRIALRASMAILAACVSGCDPGVHVAWEKDFDGTVAFECVEQALRTVAPDVRRTSYVSDGYGPRGFESGVTVTQFNYSDPTLTGGYSLDIAQLPSGTTHYWHGWGKLGTDVSDEEKEKVVPLLNRANDAVARRCGLSFEGSGPREGDG